MNETSITKTFVILIMIGFIVFTLTACTSKGLFLIITNNGNKPISDLSIKYTGGSHLIPELASKSSYSLNINPTGESSIEIRFVDSMGNDRSKQIDTYLEPGYTGTVHIQVDNTGEVTWKSEIRVR